MAERYMPQWYEVYNNADRAEDDYGELGEALESKIAILEADQAPRFRHLTKVASLYQNQDWARPFGIDEAQDRMPQQILNHIQAICDGVIAKQIVNESKATFQVSDGDWSAQVKADELDRFVAGEVYRTKQLEEMEKALQDAVAWSGDGWVKFSEDDGKVKVEHAFPLEMWLDVRSCVSTAPRELYQVRYLQKSVAMALYSEYADEIECVDTTAPPYPMPAGTSNDFVRVVEAWHLPDTDKGKNGCYVWACGKVVMEAQPYKVSRFPFVRITYARNVSGGYGISLGQQLTPLHLEINKLKLRKLIGLDLYSLPRMYMQKGSRVTPEISVDAGQIYTYTGTKPEVDMSPCYAREATEEEQNIGTQMYQIGGISPLERGQDMLSRVDSQPGVREYAAIGDEKHAAVSQAWNRATLAAALCMIDIARQITANNGEYKAFGRAKDFISKIDFKDCDLEDDRFQLTLQNTNLFPSSPAGKRSLIIDLLKSSQAFSQDPLQVFQMLAGDHPDVDLILDRSTAGRRLLEQQMYLITHKHSPQKPQVYQANDVEFCKSTCLETINKVLIQSNGGVDMYTGERIKDIDKVLALLDNYLKACDDIKADIMKEQQEQLLQAQQAAQAAQQGPPQLPPGAPPGPPPPQPTPQGAVNAGSPQQPPAQ